MNTPIVMAAFGTTTTAVTTYKSIDDNIRAAFPEQKTVWSYTSKTIKNTLQSRNNQTILDPLEALQSLAQEGHQQAVVQSLHFLGGHEFHNLKRTIAQAEISTELGTPILTSVDDYKRMSAGLIQRLHSRPADEALVLIGHGTNHSCWPGFLALEHFLRDRFGNRIFLGCAEHFPTAEETVARIARNGFLKVCLIPFMLVAGHHFQRDIIGQHPTSWKSICQSSFMSVFTIERGMGVEPVTSEILISHIHETMEKLDSDKKSTPS